MAETINLSLSDTQVKKIQSAEKNGVGVTLQLKPENMIKGPHHLVVGKMQAAKIAKHAALNKGLRITLSKATVRDNRQVIGGWLPLLAGLAGAIIPQLFGDGLYTQGYNGVQGVPKAWGKGGPGVPKVWGRGNRPTKKK